MNHANYRKYNDRSHSSSTYHKKDGTSIRAILKQEAEDEIKEYINNIRGITSNCRIQDNSVSIPK